MNEKCEGCIWLKFIKGSCRGVMDCDPDEWCCELDREEFETEEDCPKYNDHEYTKDDYDEDHWDERNER